MTVENLKQEELDLRNIKLILNVVLSNWRMTYQLKESNMMKLTKTNDIIKEIEDLSSKDFENQMIKVWVNQIEVF